MVNIKVECIKFLLVADIISYTTFALNVAKDAPLFWWHDTISFPVSWGRGTSEEGEGGSNKKKHFSLCVGIFLYFRAGLRLREFCNFLPELELQVTTVTASCTL